MIVITTNFLAITLGGIFDRSWPPLISDVIVTYPCTSSINTEIHIAHTGAMELVETFANDLEKHWLVVNINIVEATDLPVWVMDELYFLPFNL